MRLSFSGNGGTYDSSNGNYSYSLSMYAKTVDGYGGGIHYDKYCRSSPVYNIYFFPRGYINS